MVSCTPWAWLKHFFSRRPFPQAFTMSASQWWYPPLGSSKALCEFSPSRSPPEVSFACDRMPSCGNTRQLTRWRSSSLSTACKAMRTSARKRLCIRILLPCIPDMHAACPHEAMMKPVHKKRPGFMPRLVLRHCQDIFDTFSLQIDTLRYKRLSIQVA